MFRNFLDNLAHPLTNEGANDQHHAIEIDGSTISLHRHAAHAPPVVSFDWAQVTEVRSLVRRGRVPQRFWCFVTPGNHHVVPCSGLHARMLEENFIHKLPGYDDQQVIELGAPVDFESASSLWRLNDRFPKRSGAKHGEAVAVG